MKTSTLDKKKRASTQNFNEYFELFSKAIAIPDRSKRDEEIKLVFALFRRHRVLVPRGISRTRTKVEL